MKLARTCPEFFPSNFQPGNSDIKDKLQKWFSRALPEFFRYFKVRTGFYIYNKTLWYCIKLHINATLA